MKMDGPEMTDFFSTNTLIFTFLFVSGLISLVKEQDKLKAIFFSNRQNLASKVISITFEILNLMCKGVVIALVILCLSALVQMNFTD